MTAPSRLDQRIRSLRDELFAFLRRRTPDAEEIAQETWIRVAVADPDCPDERAFRAFTYTVARRLLVDQHRRRARRAPLVALEGGLEPVADERPDGGLLAGEVLAVVEQALAAMKADVAEVFRLRMTTDLSFADIAARQRVPLNTALGRHHHATKQIAAALRARGLLPE